MFENYIEPISGFMISHKKKASVFINLKLAQALPFPGLDQIGQQLIPLYDISETKDIDTSKFQDTFGFIESKIQGRKNITVAFIVLTIVFFLFAIIGTIFVCVKDRKETVEYNEFEH